MDESAENNRIQDTFLAELRQLSTIQLLVASRHIPKIEWESGKAAGLGILAASEDIKQYLEALIEGHYQLARHVRADPALRDSTMVKKAHGIFPKQGSHREVSIDVFQGFARSFTYRFTSQRG